MALFLKALFLIGTRARRLSPRVRRHKIHPHCAQPRLVVFMASGRLVVHCDKDLRATAVVASLALGDRVARPPAARASADRSKIAAAGRACMLLRTLLSTRDP